MSTKGYASWTAISSAIKATAARNAKSGGPKIPEQIEAARLDRFLSRVFADGESSEWLLKGGTSILARVPRSRATHDVGLSAAAGSLAEAAAALRKVTVRDLGDHVRFELTQSKPTGRGDNQPGVETRRLVFGCYDAATAKKIGEVPVDVVVGHVPVGKVETIEPVNRFHLPRPLPTHPYRLFPIVDQVADKVGATVATNYPGGKASSRVKDLVDLVTIARTQRLDLDELRVAIATKQAVSELPYIEAFKIPENWTVEYPRLTADTPAAGGLDDAAAAEAYVANLVEPALGRAGGPAAVWVPGGGWTDPARVEEVADSVELAPDGFVYVRSRTRSGRPVREHWRARGTYDEISAWLEESS